ncbi:MAG: DUF374 domain-containing protein [Verrucomicrobia bacterium]|nr:DUF374 domain-containing protein [Verrucomicrobiota bacterium]
MEASSRTRRAETGAPHRLTMRKRAAAFAIFVLIRLVGMTLRVRIDDPSGILDRHGGETLIFCVWHNRLALCMELYRRLFIPRRRGRQLAAMVSASKDGAMMARLLEWFGVVSARGSSSRRGPQAMLELKSSAEAGLDLALTPDGPRGPRYRAQTGAVALGQITGLPILPVSYELGWKICLRSWDRFQIPLPFSNCTIRVEEPVRVARDATEAAREEKRVELEEKLNRITRD